MEYGCFSLESRQQDDDKMTIRTIKENLCAYRKEGTRNMPERKYCDALDTNLISIFGKLLAWKQQNPYSSRCLENIMHQ